MTLPPLLSVAEALMVVAASIRLGGGTSMTRPVEA
jgi:hypothetical protein